MLNNLSFLNDGLGETNISTAETPWDIELENMAQSEDNALLSDLRYKESQVLSAMDTILDADDEVTALLGAGVSARTTARVFSNTISSAGITGHAHRSAMLGVESAGSERLGVEALSSAKSLITNIVKWFIERYKDVKAALARTWKRSMGSIKRANSAWVKLKAKVDDAETNGYVIDNKDKLVITRGPAAFILGKSSDEAAKTPESWSKIPTHISAMEKQIVAATTAALKEDMPNVDDGAVEGLSSADLIKLPTVKDGSTFNIGGDAVDAKGFGLLGRSVLISQYNTAKPDGTLPATVGEGNETQLRTLKRIVGSISFGVRPSNMHLKSLDEVKLEIPSLSEIGSLANAQIDLTRTALSFETDKKVDKITRALDKAIADSKKWISKADGDTEEEKRKNTVIAALKAEVLTNYRKQTLELVSDLISLTSSLSSSHYAACTKAMGQYKKAA